MTTEIVWRCLHQDPLPEVEPSMSNFDHVIEEGLAEAIADGAHMASYDGWEFHAFVYRPTRELYVADVHRYHVHVAFVTAATLEELMADVSDEYGAR